MKKLVFVLYSFSLITLTALLQSNCSSNATAQNTVAAATVSFDNTGTGLTATNIQDAVKELSDASGCFNSQSHIIGTWSGSTFTNSNLDIVEVPNMTWTFNADGTYTSNFGDYPSGKYRMVSCNVMFVTTSSFGNAVFTQDFLVTPTTLTISLEDAGARTVTFVLTKQ